MKNQKIIIIKHEYNHGFNIRIAANEKVKDHIIRELVLSNVNNLEEEDQAKINALLETNNISSIIDNWGEYTDYEESFDWNWGVVEK